MDASYYLINLYDKRMKKIICLVFFISVVCINSFSQITFLIPNEYLIQSKERVNPVFLANSGSLRISASAGSGFQLKVQKGFPSINSSFGVTYVEKALSKFFIFNYAFQKKINSESELYAGLNAGYCINAPIYYLDANEDTNKKPLLEFGAGWKYKTHFFTLSYKTMELSKTISYRLRNKGIVAGYNGKYEFFGNKLAFVPEVYGIYDYVKYSAVINAGILFKDLIRTGYLYNTNTSKAVFLQFRLSRHVFLSGVYNIDLFEAYAGQESTINIKLEMRFFNKKENHL
jgi:hypothetical protein